MAKKFSSLHSGSKPDSPAVNARAIAETEAAEARREIILYAVSVGTKDAYNELPEAVKAEFSYSTFERLVARRES
jgi:hypothetical protein